MYPDDIVDPKSHVSAPAQKKHLRIGIRHPDQLQRAAQRHGHHLRHFGVDSWCDRDCRDHSLLGP